MHKLILVKHSMPEIVAALPARQWSLSAEGRRRCDLLAEKLRAHAPQHVIASTEPKAMETAAIVATRLGIAWSMAEDLHEHDRSNVPFLGSDQFHTAVANFFGRPDQLMFGQETAKEARQRFGVALWRVVEHRAGQTVAIVAHGTVIALFVAEVADLDGYDLWRRLDLPSFVVLALPELRVIEIVERVEM